MVFNHIIVAKDEDKLCIWKYISDGEGHTEGRLKKCDNGCDGYDTTCEHYINHGQVRRRDLV